MRVSFSLIISLLLFSWLLLLLLILPLLVLVGGSEGPISVLLRLPLSSSEIYDLEFESLTEFLLFDFEGGGVPFSKRGF